LNIALPVNDPNIAAEIKTKKVMSFVD